MAKRPATNNIIDGLDLVITNPKEKKSTVKEETTTNTMTDSERMIELLEAIDWKLWVMYKKFNGEEAE
jgi:hypothetical protein